MGIFYRSNWNVDCLSVIKWANQNSYTILISHQTQLSIPGKMNEMTPQMKEMYFEYTMRTFFGKQAEYSAGELNTDVLRKKRYNRIFRKIVKQVQKIDTNSTHKNYLTHTSEQCLDNTKHPYDEKIFVLSLLQFINALLGYKGLALNGPFKIATLMYFQTENQNFTERLINNSQSMPNDHKENTFTLRRKLINQLKKEGKTTFEISLVFNISEYQIKKLLSEQH